MSKRCHCGRGPRASFPASQQAPLLVGVLVSSALCVSSPGLAAEPEPAASVPAASVPAASVPAASVPAASVPAAATAPAAAPLAVPEPSPAASDRGSAASAAAAVTPERAAVAPERAAVAPEPASAAAERFAVAQSLFQQGVVHWEHRRYAEAVPLFSASFDHNPLASPLLLLADCYEHLGQLRTARATFQRAAAAARQYGEADLASRAETRAAALAPRIPQLELRLPRPLPAGLVVKLNDRELSPAWLNRPLPMDAGDYRVEAHAPGYDPLSIPFRISNELPPGQPSKVVSVALRPTPDTFDRRDLALWLGGAGAAVAVAGLAVTGVALYKDNGQDPQDKNDARWLAKWLGTSSALISIPALGSAALLYYTSDEPQERSALGLRWSGEF